MRDGDPRDWGARRSARRFILDGESRDSQRASHVSDSLLRFPEKRLRARICSSARALDGIRDARTSMIMNATCTEIQERERERDATRRMRRGAATRASLGVIRGSPSKRRWRAAARRARRTVIMVEINKSRFPRPSIAQRAEARIVNTYLLQQRPR